MRAAIYARYSTELQHERSIADQERICREQALRQGWRVVEVYRDHALSGTSFLRPGLQRLMADAEARRFDVVVAEALDRLSRDQEHSARLFKQFRYLEIPLVTLQEGVVNELIVGMGVSVRCWPPVRGAGAGVEGEHLV